MPGRSAASRLPAAVVSLLAILLLLGTANAAAAPGVVQDLDGCRDNNLPANDDGSTELVPLGFEATIFDRDFDAAYVNNNGTITFDEDQFEYTPFDFREIGAPFIAPFFADVDTRGVGSGLVHYGETTFDGRDAFCVIWDHVGYYAERADKTNTFQALLVDQVDGLDLIFNYDNIAWESGSASGGTDGFGGASAAAGYAAGDGDSAHAAVLPGSFANGALLDSNATTSLAGHSTSGQPAGRYLFPLRLGPPTGGKLLGQIRDPGGTVNDGVAGAIAQICRQADDVCITRIADSDGNYRASNLLQGAYRVTAFTGPDTEFHSTTIADVPVPGPPGTVTRNIVLGPPPVPPPAGTTIEPRTDDEPDGVPSTDWSVPLELTTQGCPNGTATYTVVLEDEIIRTGPLVEGPLGTFTGQIAPLQPEHGTGEIQIDINCPGTDPDEAVDFGVYIDPSGVVRDARGVLVADADVTLFRSSSPDGPFFAVSDGTAVMSPSNRRNPDVTDDNGHFGWDVIAGFYLVRAEKSDCTAQSAVLTIPPPVTNLDLRLVCEPRPPVIVPGPVIVNPPPPTPPIPARRLASIGTVKLVKGKTLTTKVSCARTARTACSGKVGVRIGKKAVGSRKFAKLKPGKSARVKVTLTKKGRKLVRKVKKGKKVKFVVRVTVRDAAGAGASVRRTVSIRR